MKRRIPLLLLTALAACAAHGAEVGADEAEATALAFARQNAILRDRVLGVGEARRHGAGIWVVPLRPAGYVALEADDARFPVVAFSEENDFPAADLPEALDAANLDALLYAISRDGTLTAPEALDRIEDLAAFGYEYGDNLLMSTVPRPAIEVVGVEPGAVRFRLIDAAAANLDASAAELAWREIPVTLEAGETLDALAPVEAQPPIEDYGTGTLKLTLPESAAPTRFFRLRAGQDATTP